jgi:hypothetical protein
MAVTLEAEGMALWLNIDIEEGVGRYENQNERQGWFSQFLELQPDDAPCRQKGKAGFIARLSHCCLYAKIKAISLKRVERSL